jgi:S-adenosylmethionine decarboxylase
MDEFRKMLLECCNGCGVIVLHDYFYSFGQTNGFTGVICLSESHISIHTWPENFKMCVDVFMCNNERSDTFMKLLNDKIIVKCIKHDIRTIERM